MTAVAYGSDLIVDLLIDAGVEHVALNPGASFRGIHDSLVQSDAPQTPELALCLHESIAVSVGHGYAKAAGKPMAVLLHDIVGLQQATMAIYNAWCDRVPVLLLGGSGPMSKAKRRPWIDWIHTASAQAELIRDYVKWDDEPRDAASVTESFARGLRTACAEPPGPVYLCYDAELQEAPLVEAAVTETLADYPLPSTPAPAAADVAAIAAALREAERPLLAVGYPGQGEGFAPLGDLAELVGAAVVDTGVRLALASTHPLNGTGVEGLVEQADVIVRLDAEDPLGLVRGRSGAAASVFDVSLAHMRLRSWAHDYQALEPAQRSVSAGTSETVRALSEALAEHPPAGAGQRREQLSARIAQARGRWQAEAANASDERGIPLLRLVHELGEQLAGRRYVLANGTNERLEHRLWALERPGQYLGWHAGGGLGYGPGAAIGAALADPSAIAVDVQADGDLLFVPGALWTMAQLELPVLVVVHNNRQYGNTVEHAAAIARERGRDPERRYAGAGLATPPIDFAGLARSMGVWGSGPVAEEGDLGPSLERAIEVVSDGRPALVEVLTPGF